MMKAVAASLLVVLCLATAVAAVQTSNSAAPQFTIKPLSIQKVAEPAAPVVGKPGALCNLCVQFMDQALQALLNIILNGGVLGSCAKLCGKLGNQVEAEVCDVLCSIVGIDAFIHMIQKADLDPVWMCEELKTCPVVKGGQVSIISTNIAPKQGPQGSTFNLAVSFKVINATGTGEIAFQVQPPSDMPFGGGSLNTGMDPGNYNIQAAIETQPNEQEAFEPGLYQGVFVICEGSCGSHHSNTGIYAQSNFQFTITGH